MTDHSSASIRPPKDWQDFERSCRILFECILDDLHVQNNGRAGQVQHGVDIFGRKNGKGTKYFGIQCKGKDANYGGEVTEKELRKEVNKSRKFNSELSDFILVTTAPDDQAIQAVARAVTEEREKEGKPLNVSVWGWGTLEARISAYPKALNAFHPDATPFSDQILSNTAHLVTKSDEQTTAINQILQTVQGLQKNVIDDGTSAAMEALDKSLHAEIDGYRDLINDGKPITALRLLEGLRDRIWDSASDRIKFRIITNIGASKLNTSKEKEQEAIEHFLEAITYQPDDKIALANVALAYLLKKEPLKAIEAATTALKKDQGNTNAASCLIQAHINDTSIADPRDLVPDKISMSAPVDIACINFYRMKNDARWIEVAKEARDRHIGNVHISRYAAEADLENAVSAKGFLVGERPEIAINKVELEKAAEVLQKEWDDQCSSENPAASSSLPYNLVQIYRVLGNKTSAKNVAAEAIKSMPDVPNLIHLRATFYLNDGQPVEARELLSQLSSDPESILVRSEILSKEDPEAALNMLENFEQLQGVDSQHRIIAGKLRVDCYLSPHALPQEEKLKHATELSTTLLQQFPNSLQVMLIRSHVLEASGDDVGLKQALSDAKKLLVADTRFYERFLLAERFETLERYSDAADILNGYVDPTHDSPALRTLFFSLINCDRRSQAYELLSTIPKKVAEQPIFLRATISLHFRRGQHASAERAISILLKQKPNDLRTHLNRVDIWLRHRNDKDLKRFLATDVESLSGKPEEFMRLAHLLDRFGFYERALKLAYKTHLMNRKNPQVQLAYIGLLLKPGSSDKTNLQRKTIETDTAFSIKNASGEIETFIVEEDEALQVIDEAVEPTHLFAVAATGLKQGDLFQVSNGEEWEIVSVKHKYLHLLHSKMETFERHFPGNGGLQRFTIKEEGEKSIEPILQKIKEKHDAIELILDKYMDFPLPLEIFAKQLGTDVIETWYGLAQKGRKFQVCQGNIPERVAAVKNIAENNKAGCVVDALTLHIIRLLNIENVVADICGSIAVTESTIDIFRYRREQILSHGGKPFMMMSWRDGNYYRDEITKGQLDQILANVDSELYWITQTVEVLPAESKDVVPDEAGRIRDALSYDFLDSILSAQGSNKLLLCEDQSYRQFGKIEFCLKTSWLQPVLILALENGLISKEKYAETISSLVKAGHSFTSIDTEILSYALEHTEQNIEIVAKALFGADAEMDSHIRVMRAFLDNIWSGTPPNFDELKATSILLLRLFGGEWSRNIQNVSAKNTLLLLAPFKNKRFNDYLIKWLKGHLLIPFNA